MILKRVFWLGSFLALSAFLASADSLTFVCDTTSSADPDTYAAGTCSYLNSVIAPLYTSTFTNVDARIYIEQGNAGLGQSQTPLSYVPFSTYLSVLTSTASSDAVDTGAIAALNSLDSAVYGSNEVVMTSGLASALGFSGVGGITASGGSCTISVSNPNCYSGIITISASEPLYYRQDGGTIPSNEYDYYSVVEHETDEILGTVSCMSTTSSTLQNTCGSLGSNTPSAIDLFRYNSPGELAANSAYVGEASAPAGAYFSYDGGATNGADGAVFNTVANGDDYADFTNTCTYVQDGVGCSGQIFNITTDGGAEINMLDAVGYNVVVPEPGTILLFGSGLAGLAAYRRRRA